MFLNKIFKGNSVQYLASITGGFATIAFGANAGWSSPYLPQLLSNSSSIPITSEQASWCAISPLIGCAFGAAMAANLADRLGRKNTLLLMSPVVIACFISIAYVTTIWWLFAFRFIIGMTDGATYTVLPMYVGEISDPGIRGFLSSIICLYFIVGTLFINCIGSFLDIFTSSWICAAIPAVHLLTFIFMPESPYYYVRREMYEEAAASMRMLKGELNVDKHIDIIRNGIAKEKAMTQKPRLVDLVMVPSNRKASLIFLILIIGNKLSGKAPVMLYTKMIFEESGSSIDATLSTIIYYVIELVVVAFATYFIVDRFGKRCLMILSVIGCATSMFFLALYFYLKHIESNILVYLDWLPLTALILYNILYSIGLGFGPISFLSELFPINVKANALCTAEIITVTLSAVSSKFFQMTNDFFNTMSVPFFFFSVCTWITLVFIIKLVPETKGKSLEEIQDFLVNSNKCKTGSQIDSNIYKDSL